jgi:hypothetical protein
LRAIAIWTWTPHDENRSRFADGDVAQAAGEVLPTRGVKAVLTALIVIKTIPFLLSIVANMFYLLSMLAGYRFFSSGENGEENRASEALPPVTIMIPLRGVDFGAYRNYASFCKQAY